jgi:hypothetical protein
LAIGVTSWSYATNMTFTPQWLVWAVAGVFAIVAILAFEWPRALKSRSDSPTETHRHVLIWSIPLAFLASSQVCGLGTRACSGVCHATNLALIGLGTPAALRLKSGRSVAPVLVPMIVVSLNPHCVCHAPVNTVWHRMFGGFASTCEMVPMAAGLFAVSALRGVRRTASTALVVAMFGVMAFIAVGGTLFGFPWQGCVDHPASG